MFNLIWVYHWLSICVIGEFCEILLFDMSTVGMVKYQYQFIKINTMHWPAEYSFMPSFLVDLRRSSSAEVVETDATASQNVVAWLVLSRSIVQFLIDDWVFLCTSGGILNLNNPFGFVMAVLRKAMCLDSSVHSTWMEAPVFLDCRVNSVSREEIYMDFQKLYFTTFATTKMY